MFLADRALVWFMDLPGTADHPLTVTTFWTAFEEQYSGPGTHYAVEQALTARKQTPGEDADVYIRYMANRLGWDQDRTMQHLIARLNNELKLFVMVRISRTILRALQKLKP